MNPLTREQKTELMGCLHREIQFLKDMNRRDKYHPQAIQANTDWRNKRIAVLESVHKAIDRSAAVLLLDEPTFPTP